VALLLPFYWLINGVLALVFSLAGHWLSILLIPPLAWLAFRGPHEHRPWVIGAGVMGLLASVLAPMPVPALLLLMAVSGGIAMLLERFNPASLHWRITSGLALYALAGLGFAGFQLYLERWASASLLIAQGQNYFSILVGIAMYGIPIGYLALLAQALLVHPPIPGSGKPEELINNLRARNED
jgi:hypothetical protein